MFGKVLNINGIEEFLVLKHHIVWEQLLVKLQIKFLLKIKVWLILLLILHLV